MAWTSAPSCSKARGASDENAPFAQSTPIRIPERSEPKRSTTCPRYVVGDAGELLDRAASRRDGVEERLDLLLVLVDELSASAEDLDAVVLGRVVRRGDDDAEVLGEEAPPPESGGHRREPQFHLPRRCRAPPPARAPGRSARVSRPTRTRPPPAHSVAAFAIRSTSSGVRSRPTTPRTPSVPK